MEAVLILGVIFGSIITIIVIILGFIFLMTKIKRGGSFRQSDRLQANEARLIQEIHQGLLKMEERVEALETILLDREAKEERKEGNK